MVNELKPQKDVFWKALVFTIIIFLIGVALGYLLEVQRINEVDDSFEDLLLEWNDAEVLSLYYENLLKEDFCSKAIEQNLEFGDKIYEAGIQLDKFENANRLRVNLIKEKKNYALLKTKFYINSKIIKEKCVADYEFVLYFYLDDANLELKQKQDVMSRVLLDLKYELGDKIILIPLPADLNISAINIILEEYGVKEYPSIVLKDNVVLTDIQTLDDLLVFFKQ